MKAFDFRVVKLYEKKDIPKALQEFQRFVFQLHDGEFFPCELTIQVMFIRGGCPHSD